jgi:hypothetical protein
MRGGMVSGHHTVCVIRAAESRRLRDDRSPARATQWNPAIEEVPMSIKTDDRLDEMRERIGELEAKAARRPSPRRARGARAEGRCRDEEDQVAGHRLA